MFNKISPYIRLARLDKPTGIWLLFIPCVFGLLLAGAGDFWLYILFLLGAVIMRSAGCAINDIIDRNIDAQVERTKTRPIASGEISKRNGLIFTAVLFALGLVILLQLNITTIVLGILIVPFIFAYPAMKKITYFPQLFLGITFNFGVIMGYAAVTGDVSIEAIALYLGCIFWTLGYDTIYALQDIEDDARIGMKSTAITFGKNWKGICAVCYIIFIALFILSSGFSLFIIAAFALLFWQIRYAKTRYPRLCLAAFKSNLWVGVLLCLSLI